MSTKLSRDHIRRRILHNLEWGNLPFHVIEPLPPQVSTPQPAIPSSEPPSPPQQPRSALKQFVKNMVTSVPFLGRMAVVLIMSVRLPLRLAGALAGKLQNVAGRIDHLTR
jgi:hypothetical protein